MESEEKMGNFSYATRNKRLTRDEWGSNKRTKPHVRMQLMVQQRFYGSSGSSSTIFIQTKGMIKRAEPGIKVAFILASI